MKKKVLAVCRYFGESIEPFYPPFFTSDIWERKVFCCDINADMDYIGLITDLAPVATASYDAVVTGAILNMSRKSQIPSVLSAIWRVLRPGGFLIARNDDIEGIAISYASASEVGEEAGVSALNDHLFSRGEIDAAVCRSMFVADEIKKEMLLVNFNKVTVWRENSFQYILGVK